MSFTPGSTGPLDYERVQAREQEAELKAEQYSRLHPDGSERLGSRRELLGRLLDAVRLRARRD